MKSEKEKINTNSLQNAKTELEDNQAQEKEIPQTTFFDKTTELLKNSIKVY